MAHEIDRVYQQADPAKPLEPNDPRYVPCDGVRDTGDLVGRVAHSIRRTATPVHLLFTGHRGAGKSTELRRLKEMLSHPPKGTNKFFVVQFEADEEDVDVNDIDFPDLLLAIIRQVGKAFRESGYGNLRPGRLLRFIDDSKDLLGSDVVFDKVDIDAKLAKFTAIIKNSPNARATIRKALEPNVSNLIQAANDLLEEAVIRLKEKGFHDLVLIVDNLDRIVLRDIPDSQFNTHEQLFINRGAQLTQLHCHIIYTLPVSMLLSPKVTALTGIFGKAPFNLPMVKVISRDKEDNLDGMVAMGDMVRRRLAAAGVTETDAFDSPETLDYLCRMSGGHPRNLLILLRSACDYLDALPITSDAAQKSAQGMRSDYTRALSRPEFFDVLRHVDQTQDLPGDEDDQLLLYNLSILEYINGEPWYAVNPAVRTMEKFKNPKKPLSRSSDS